MPTYDYECSKCGYKFEAFQKMSERPLAECPKCKGALQRLIGAGGGFIFVNPRKNDKLDDKDNAGCKQNLPQCRGCPNKEQ